VNNTTRFYIVSPEFDYNQNTSIAEEYAQSTVWELDFTVNSANGAIVDWVGSSHNCYAYPRVYGSTYGINNEYNYKTNLTDGQILGENLGVGKFYINNTNVYNATAGLSGSQFEWYFSSSGVYATNGYVPYVFVSDLVTNDTMPSFTIGTSIYHSIDFKLLGSPFSSLWNIMVNGTTYQADSSNIYLNMTNGYYNIIVNLPAGYSAITKGVLYVNGTNQVYKIFVSYNNNSGISNDIIYAIILASIIVAAAIYFSKRS
jgi:hypothetical protein